MKIPDYQKEEIISGLVPLLDPEAVEKVEEIKEVEGHNLINLHGIYQDQNGAQILPGVVYNVCTTEIRKVNHPQRIGQIIADCNTREEWETKLAEHLVKFALDKNAVINSIPVKLSLHNIKRNGN